MAEIDYLAKIQAVKQEIKTAGPIHKRDLIKHLHRLQKKLQTEQKMNRG